MRIKHRIFVLCRIIVRSYNAKLFQAELPPPVKTVIHRTEDRE